MWTYIYYVLMPVSRLWKKKTLLNSIWGYTLWVYSNKNQFELVMRRLPLVKRKTWKKRVEIQKRKMDFMRGQGKRYCTGVDTQLSSGFWKITISPVPHRCTAIGHSCEGRVVDGWNFNVVVKYHHRQSFCWSFGPSTTMMCTCPRLKYLLQ